MAKKQEKFTMPTIALSDEVKARLEAFVVQEFQQLLSLAFANFGAMLSSQVSRTIAAQQKGRTKRGNKNNRRKVAKRAAGRSRQKPKAGF
jgi:hypothetical protein